MNIVEIIIVKFGTIFYFAILTNKKIRYSWLITVLADVELIGRLVPKTKNAEPTINNTINTDKTIFLFIIRLESNSLLINIFINFFVTQKVK